MATIPTIKQFNFKVNSEGHYYVTYTTQSGKIYRAIIKDVKLIDATKNSSSPTSKALRDLRTKIQENYK